jgi:hypothetical protein
MGSRLSNTSWCWSPRQRCPEHVVPIRKKTFEEMLEEKHQDKLFEEWWQTNRWKYVEGKSYDHNDKDYNT